MPTPLVSWPLTPQGVGSVEFGQGEEPGRTVFIILRGKENPGLVPPLEAPPIPPWSRSLHRLQTFWLAMLLPSFATIVAVHVPGVQYPVPAKAVSKKGWGVTAAAFWAQFEPASPASPPQYCNATWAYALSKRWPPRVIM